MRNCFKNWFNKWLFSYGLDAELKAKRDAGADPKLEAEAREWIETVGGMPIGPDFGAGLRDGIILYANILKQLFIPKYL